MSRKLFMLSIFLTLALSACNGVAIVPVETQPAPPTAIVLPTATPVQIPTIVPTAVQLPTSIPATSQPAPATTVPGACTNSAEFVADVTVPDGSSLQSDVAFTKTWRVKNTGTCTWDSRYAVAFVDGTLFSAYDAFALSVTAAPGQTVDISLPMRSPIYPGVYESDWKMRTPDGKLFGVGQKDTPLWVKLNIGSSQSNNVIAGFIYMDKNGNLRYDYNADELMANRTVQLQQGSCAQGGMVLATAVSGADGRYALSGNFSGTLCVALQGNQVMDDSVDVNVAAGKGSTTMIDLRAASPDARIVGRVWNDTAQPDGVIQSGEPSYAGVTVMIQKGPCATPGATPYATVTDAQGYFQFSQLYGGTYCISVRADEGGNPAILGSGAWTNSLGGYQQVTVLAGQETSVNFGWQVK
jgi:hypothetical protein